MFRSWGAIGSPIFAEVEGGRGQNGTFLGDFTWNDPHAYLHVPRTKCNFSLCIRGVHRIMVMFKRKKVANMSMFLRHYLYTIGSSH